MVAKTKSIVRVSKAALTADIKARTKAETIVKRKTGDSFINFAANMGLGTDNLMSGSTYGFNPITRQRTLLEWIHRGSWLGGLAVDIVADDMTRAGVELKGEIEPDGIEAIDEAATSLKIWQAVGDTVRWSRLYGGCIAVILIDGQDTEEPLRINTIRKGQFCGLQVFDRWMLDPSLNDLVTQLGPDLGLPKYYTVTPNAPALTRQKIHHSRCLRLEGIHLPYQQRITENLWGISVLERLYDRMVAFDSASTGAAQLVYKAHLRTLKVEDLREIVAAGGDAMNGLIAYVQLMRRYQGNEGVTLLDSKDDFQADVHGAFSGLSDVLSQFGQQIAGALQIPLTRLFGQSPAGFSTGDTDLKNYYDGILAQQQRDLKVPMTRVYRCLAASEDIELPEGFSIKFKSLWQLTDDQKADISTKVVTAITAVEGAGIITRKIALQELKQSADVTNIFSNITQEDIDATETDLPPSAEGLLPPQGGEEAPSQLQAPVGDTSGAKYALIRPQGTSGWVVQASTGERLGIYPTSEKAASVALLYEKIWNKEHAASEQAAKDMLEKVQ